jgi:hypothetical protein
MKRAISYLIVAAIAMASGSRVRADVKWDLIILDDTPHSRVAGVYGNVQVGRHHSSQRPFWTAALWKGAPGSFIALNPKGAKSSEATGNYDNVQVGYADFLDDHSHAGLWHGTSVSWVDLHPRNADWSEALGICGKTQVGFTTMSDGSQRACLWHGTAASWKDLHPTRAQGNSYAQGAWGDSQVGRAEIPIRKADSWDGWECEYHACLWHGTAPSWVDLNPEWAVESDASAVSGNTQVGTATTMKTWHTHAVLWHGTASSCIDLNPPGALSSYAYGVSKDLQVGATCFPAQDSHAGYWRDTPESWVDLNPAGYSSSFAYAVHQTATDIWIVGFVESAEGKQYAAMWHMRDPVPPNNTGPEVKPAKSLAVAK